MGFCYTKCILSGINLSVFVHNITVLRRTGGIALTSVKQTLQFRGNFSTTLTLISGDEHLLTLTLLFKAKGEAICECSLDIRPEDAGVYPTLEKCLEGGTFRQGEWSNTYANKITGAVLHQLSLEEEPGGTTSDFALMLGKDRMIYHFVGDRRTEKRRHGGR